jgi:hypothetical protein
MAVVGPKMGKTQFWSPKLNFYLFNFFIQLYAKESKFAIP